MSLDFDGVDDVVASDATQTWGSTLTVAAWFDADTQGEGDQGVLVVQDGSAAGKPRFGLLWNSTAASKKLRVRGDRATTDGVWEMTTGFAAVTGAKWVAVTYDMSDVANDPILYTYEAGTFSTLTVGSGLTETGTPVGAPTADNKTARLGNISDTSRTFDGRLGEIAVWTRILTAAEVAAVFALGVNAVPDHFNYLPLDPTAQNLGSSATTFTITGAVSGANPPIRMGRRG